MEMEVPKLVMRTGPLESVDPASLDEFLHQVPGELFRDFGVVVPIPQRLQDDTLAAGTAVLELNGRPLGTIRLMNGVNPVEAIGLLEEHAGELVVPDLVEFFLVKLRQRLPALVDAVRLRFSMESLCTALRSRVEKGESIKNLPSILEKILAESV